MFSSAADQTKLAMLLLDHNEEWQRIGGRLLIPVHDELIAEVPMEVWDEGGQLLSKLMCDAASFLPFGSKCDVTTTLRWYGLEYPCKYKHAESVDTRDEDEIKWIQYHLVECEYQLPVIKEADGSKPRGDAALGVNGVRTPEMEAAIDDYIQRYQLPRDKFLEHIENFVEYGEL